MHDYLHFKLVQHKLSTIYISPMFLRVVCQNHKSLRFVATEASKIKGTGKDGEITYVNFAHFHIFLIKIQILAQLMFLNGVNNKKAIFEK